MEIAVTHKNADFDAIASLFAAAVLYSGVVPVLPKNVNVNASAFLSIHKNLLTARNVDEVDLAAVTKLIVVDANNWARIDGADQLKEIPGLDIHMWDHHPDSPDIRANRVIYEPTGAATTLLALKMMDVGVKLSPIHATLFMAGIYEDTGNLTFPSTTSKDATAVGYLLEQKADLSVIRRFLRPTYGPRHKDVLFEMLKSAKRLSLNGFHISLNRITVEGHTPGLSMVVDMFRDIMNVDAAFGIFTEKKRDRTMVIGRSAVDGLNIGFIMRSMGGGGHPRAGSAMLKFVNPVALEEWIIELVNGTQQSSVQLSDLMSFPVFTVAPDTPISQVAALLMEKGCTGLPVVENDKVLGVISRRDLTRVNRFSKPTTPVKAFMSSKVIQISPRSGVNEAARLMVKHDIGRLPIIEDEHLIGIITRSDVMRYLYDLIPD
ncbi:MAG: CBS domain-containing protein [Deltaproteobacteria bacterium]|nr:CBS domain-containing protein [Deltaproteobacteria bacterium]